ncbi:hypothetical protein LPJ56_003088 [Coemansia sp. RSA 2599]|nr:hypothetical protein LPJ75_002832 [Coemansia sp. RSA 2598]KAJ1822386.1 hypothetical protein LPJ56_003088 [Coemansia sp. RSA 2599]
MLYPGSELLFSAGAVVFDRERKNVLTIVNTDEHRGLEDILFPKGRIEKGETPEEAAVREVREETGAKCVLWPGLMGPEIRYNAKLLKTKVMYWYAATLVEMGDQQLDENENFTVRWVDIDSANSVLSFEDDRKLLGVCLSAAATNADACVQDGPSNA